MTATNDIRAKKKPQLTRLYGHPVLSGQVIYGGTAVGLTAAGAAVPAGHAQAVKLIGHALERADNVSGGGATVTVEKDVRLITLAGATPANIGQTVYCSADDTYTLVAGALLAIGTIDNIDADGVWLKTL